MSVKADMAKIVLQSPVCTEVDEKIALSRRIDKHWRLIGTYLLFPLFVSRTESGDAKETKRSTDLLVSLRFLFCRRLGRFLQDGERSDVV